MSLLTKFDQHLVPETKLSWSIMFLICNGIILGMYFLGYDDVEVGTTKFYSGMVIVFLFLILGIALGRGLKVWYQPTKYSEDKSQ